MNVVTILGSPRKKGSSSTLAKQFNETAIAKGATVKTYNLNTMDFRGCQGCMVCKTKQDECVLKDDLTQVLKDIHEADVLVVSSPIYYHSITAQMKTFWDRTYSFLNPDFFNRTDPSRLPAGKKSLLILTQAAPESSHSKVAEEYNYFLNFYGFKENETIRACGLEGHNDADVIAANFSQIEKVAEKFIK
ncbi:flavodoxin family protein [Maridesulfovibrio frigidus]|uniref:flavodoxin family protein n=1 Tax=Maridesulfovibrio frigidus TaxID=340956 RepID=UPI0004E1420F|nr:flavodoxin family protein [Maridesulfovibrio frigidus]